LWDDVHRSSAARGVSYSSIWGEEIVRYSFIYLAWIGAASAVRERGHIRIDVIMHYLGPRGESAALHVRRHRHVRGRLGRALLVFWNCHVSWKFGSVSHGLRVSMVWFLMAVPFGLRFSSRG
jgi:C4-dicarboxylate transporter DctQ subunit